MSFEYTKTCHIFIPIKQETSTFRSSTIIQNDFFTRKLRTKRNVRTLANKKCSPDRNKSFRSAIRKKHKQGTTLNRHLKKHQAFPPDINIFFTETHHPSQSYQPHFSSNKSYRQKKPTTDVQLTKILSTIVSNNMNQTTSIP